MTATTGTCRKIDVNIVIFGVDRFLDKRFVKDSTVNFNKVIGFHYVAFCIQQVIDNTNKSKLYHAFRLRTNKKYKNIKIQKVLYNISLN